MPGSTVMSGYGELVTVEFYSFEMLTGRRLMPLPVTSASWSIATNADEKISCTIPARAVTTSKLGVWQVASLANTGLLTVVDGLPVAAGPLWKRQYGQGKTIELTAGGLRSYWARRFLLPPDARSTPLVDANGDAVTSLDFAVSNLSFGTIAKRYIERAQLWPGGALPLTLPPDVAGTHEDSVKAVDLKTVKSLLDNLQAREGGPDIAFRPRMADDGLGVFWEMQTGSDAQPRLGNPDPSLVQWVVGAPGSGAFDLNVEEDATSIADEAWSVGGGTSDRVLTAHAYNPKLSETLRTPLLQTSRTGLNSIVKQERMQEHANQAAYLSQFVASFWTMGVRAHEPGSPALGDYWLGDLSTVTVSPDEGTILPGNYARRIAGISGTEKNDSYRLTFAEAVV